jgi:hypothetical protein
MNAIQPPSSLSGRKASLASATLGFVLATLSSEANQITLDAVVTRLPDAVRYDLTVNNQTSEDLVLISLLGGPLGDARIDMTLSAPPGFLTNYDSGLGIVDFLGDSEVFGAGSILTGFSFETSPTTMLGFGFFEALSVQGTMHRGSVNITAVPESGPGLATLVLLGGIFGHVFRRRILPISVR